MEDKKVLIQFHPSVWKYEVFATKPEKELIEQLTEKFGLIENFVLDEKVVRKFLPLQEGRELKAAFKKAGFTFEKEPGNSRKLGYVKILIWEPQVKRFRVFAKMSFVSIYREFKYYKA